MHPTKYLQLAKKMSLTVESLLISDLRRRTPTASVLGLAATESHTLAIAAHLQWTC
eukprot:CCRYP_014563-RA/>CCRYP_014563-RA protein AED:0.49 eAED:0.49 QI:0/-1/0/1/-1/0/1/0/55